MKHGVGFGKHGHRQIHKPRGLHKRLVLFLRNIMIEQRIITIVKYYNDMLIVECR